MSQYNSILITGTAQNVYSDTANGRVMRVVYNVMVWAHKAGGNLQFIMPLEKIDTSGYEELWERVKDEVTQFYNEPKFKDGAHTCFLDHITTGGTITIM